MRTGFEWHAWLEANHKFGYADALQDGGPFGGLDLRDEMSPREVLDLIVAYEGGIASGFEVSSLVSLLWGIELPRDAAWELEGEE